MTAASTADTPMSSAGMNATYPVMSETVISAGGLSRRRRTCRTSQPTPSPTAIPPPTLTTKSPVVCHSEKEPVRTAATATRYATRPVPSLTRLSPSTMVTSFRGTPRRRAIDVAASGSVGDTIAPSTNAAPQESPSTSSCATTATPTVVTTTSPIASKPIGLAVRAQIAEGREESGAVEQRWQDAEEDELRRQLELGHARSDPDEQPAENEQDRVRDPEGRSEREHRRDRNDERQRDDPVLDLEMHVSIVP